MAMTADKLKESSVVTRTFIVHEGEKDKDNDVSCLNVYNDYNCNFLHMTILRSMKL